MTLQQLEYIIAVENNGSFVQAANACGVSQSALSTLIQRLENELDVTIFDRNSRPISTTQIGKQILAQAKVIVYNARQMEEIVANERTKPFGDVSISIIPTIAPYITPKLFKFLNENYPNVAVHAYEMTQDESLTKLKNAEVEMAIMSLPHGDDSLLEIPLYKEKFFLYVSPQSPLYAESEIDLNTITKDHLWSLKDDLNFKTQVADLCDREVEHSSVYEAGSTTTLTMIVDENGGYTTIPELHINLLPFSKRTNVRSYKPTLSRKVSLFVRKDYVRERMINIVAEAIKNIIPENMLDQHILKYSIRL